jgi:hypothetical protein
MSKIKVYWDYSIDNRELTVKLYPTKENVSLRECELDESFIEAFELAQYSEYETDDELHLFDESIPDEDWEKFVFDKIKKAGKYEEYVCGAINSEALDHESLISHLWREVEILESN